MVKYGELDKIEENLMVGHLQNITPINQEIMGEISLIFVTIHDDVQENRATYHPHKCQTYYS